MAKRRKLEEIQAAEDKLRKQVWYNRHCVLMERIADGKTRIVEDQDRRTEDHGRTWTRSTYERAQAAARRVEERIGLDELGPWDDVEWGMLNGKLSALRWVLGCEWDFLDT
jgi:hypothetical protein